MPSPFKNRTPAPAGVSPRDSLLARALEPFVAGLWILFVLASLVIAAVWTMDIGESSLEQWVSNPDLRATLLWLLARADFGWITLAAVNVYSSLAGNIGLANTRRWALIVAGGVIALAWVSVATGFPLGPIRYSGHLGPKLGPIPLGLPSFWLSVIIGGAGSLAALLFPVLIRRSPATGVGKHRPCSPISTSNRWPPNSGPSGFGKRTLRCRASSIPHSPPAWRGALLAGLLTLALRERTVAVSAQKAPLATSRHPGDSSLSCCWPPVSPIV